MEELLESEADTPRMGEFASKPDPQLDYQHTICIRYEVKTKDSGYENSVGIEEDVWPDANRGQRLAAYYGRIDVGPWTYDLDANGCTQFWHSSQTPTLAVRVYGYAEDPSGNLVRIHDGSDTWTGAYPAYGAPGTHSIYVGDVYFDYPNTEYVNVGDYTPRWTAMNALAKSLTRYADGLSDTQFHLAESSNCNNVAKNYHNDVAADRSYLRIPGLSCASGTHMKAKFLVAHEYGHAYLQQYANQSGVSPLSDNSAGNLWCSDGGTNAYHSFSLEWSSRAFVEGYAHFISARIWNYKANDGQLWWGSDPPVSSDLERCCGGSSPAGGHLINVCCQSGGNCPSSVDGRGIMNDWLRAVWDLHTDGAGCNMSKENMAIVYLFTITNGSLSNDSFWTASKSAVVWFGSTCYDRWLLYGCHNGVDREGQAWTGSC